MRSETGGEKKGSRRGFLLGSPEAFWVFAWRKLTVGDAGFRTNCTEFLTELLDAASGVDDLVLAGEERVRFSRHLDLDQWVLLAFEFGRFAGVDGRTGDEFEIAGQVVEDDFAVIRMDIGFHGFALVELVAKRHFVGRPAS